MGLPPDVACAEHPARTQPQSQMVQVHGAAARRGVCRASRKDAAAVTHGSGAWGCRHAWHLQSILRWHGRSCRQLRCTGGGESAPLSPLPASACCVG
eukprot:364234-Chlamydomonas_euryale.AAC.18